MTKYIARERFTLFFFIIALFLEYASFIAVSMKNAEAARKGQTRSNNEQTENSQTNEETMEKSQAKEETTEKSQANEEMTKKSQINEETTEKDNKLDSRKGSEEL